MTALSDLGDAIERALDECAVSDVLSVLVGTVVGVTVEVVRRKGGDPSNVITIDGGDQRDLTISAAKQGAVAGSEVAL